jgi:hypothetical protein
MNDLHTTNRLAAKEDFRQARQKAWLDALLSKVTRHTDKLLSFEEVQVKLRLDSPGLGYIDKIPLDSIIGSVGRYQDFNRFFRPLKDDQEQRWTKIRALAETQGLPPIEVYKVGEVYFVLDGNHRVSVARELETVTIEAYVREFKTDVKLDPGDHHIESVIMKAEYADLMKETHLDKIRPDLDFHVTVPGRAFELSEHIAVHRYYMGQEQGREIQIEEAAASWVDNVYLPVVETIRELKILEDFPGRTETDLYLWLQKHHWELSASIGNEVPIEEAAQDLSKKSGFSFLRKLRRLWRKTGLWFARFTHRR